MIDPAVYDKRAIMGFQGMRGKKDSADKRTPMGFQGMRGKRTTVADVYDASSKLASGSTLGSPGEQNFNLSRYIILLRFSNFTRIYIDSFKTFIHSSCVCFISLQSQFVHGEKQLWENLIINNSKNKI